MALKVDWLITTDNRVLISGLYDNQSASYVNDATISGQLADAAGATVGDAVSLSYIDSSDGNYAGNLPNSVSLTEGDVYTMTITITSGSYKKTIKLTGKAVYADE